MGKGGVAGRPASAGGAGQGPTAACGASGHGDGGTGGVVFAGAGGATAGRGGAPDAGSALEPRSDAASGPPPLAFDPLDYPNAPWSGLSLGNNSLSGGQGWSDSWDYGEPNAQFAIADARPLTVSGVGIGRKYIALARGEVGRPFDVRATFKRFAVGDDIGADGTELWFSLALRVDGEANDGGLSLAMHQDPNGFHLYGTTWSAGAKPLKAGSKWALFAGLADKGAATATTTKPVTIGVATLIVLRFGFQPGSDRIDLWIDPARGADDPGPPDASVTTGANLLFKGFGVSSPAAISIAAPRMGTSYRSVTPP